MNFTVKCKHFKDLTTYELYEIMNIRQVVFVVEQNCPYIDTDGRDLEAWHLGIFDEKDKLVAYTRLLPKGIAYEDYISIGRVVSDPSVRKLGIGRKLMETSIQYCDDIFGKQAIKIGAQKYLTRFYESLGFVSTGDEYMEDGIPHVSMIRKASV